MPATATKTAVPTEHMTLVDAARIILPHARGNSGYDRLRRTIERHRCPVPFSYGFSAKGRQCRVLRSDDLPTLQSWFRQVSGN